MTAWRKPSQILEHGVDRVMVYLRVASIVLVILTSMLPIWIAKKSGYPALLYAFIRGTYWLVALVIGVRVRVRGKVSTKRPLLLVSNHISYLDIIAFGSALPVVFTPKSEIAGWPVIGTICRLVGCAFIDRRAVKTASNMDAITHALEGNRPVLLFAEGTTGDSKRLLPLRSSYFQIAQVGDAHAPVTVQPVLLTYKTLHGLPLDSTTRPLVAWVGDEALFPHLEKLVQRSPIEVEIEFFEEIDAKRFENRKKLATYVEEILHAGHQNSL